LDNKVSDITDAQCNHEVHYHVDIGLPKQIQGMV